ncbi:phosphoglycerate mutase family 2 [Geomicrobium sp. JCM 19037]|uniref:histidine phosphatase family protein n=1 Tax=Geomicrobium sp. JCM 19037 TaxID=1460634 RepID=UPI00045F3096|nr:histidine phosphatase family protein [Geomicrobium sp. JCM 19037]GAK02709.1 phosphoglycerate mutase family 2 [Geomicrobium sp. JCM 19037]
MDQTIYLVRHAHANYQADERTRELSERGMKERQLLADYFEGISITAIVSSPYRRAVQTVETVAEKKGLPITCDERFRERLIRKGYIENFTEVVKQMWQNHHSHFLTVNPMK